MQGDSHRESQSIQLPFKLSELTRAPQGTTAAQQDESGTDTDEDGALIKATAHVPPPEPAPEPKPAPKKRPAGRSGPSQGSSIKIILLISLPFFPHARMRKASSGDMLLLSLKIAGLILTMQRPLCKVQYAVL